jgi:hypothetical protein
MDITVKLYYEEFPDTKGYSWPLKFHEQMERTME